MYTITGIITTYKREANVVKRAIQSMQTQTYPLLEIIVVDDNGTDDPLCAELKVVCENYCNVTYVKQDGNKGACAARNLGIEKAKGEYLAFLDDDDEWLPDKIEKQIEVFSKTEKNVGLVSVSGYLFNEDSGEKDDYFNYKTFDPNPTFKDMLAMDYVGSTSQPLIKAECFRKVGGFANEQPARQDYEMWLRISRVYKIVCLKDQLFVHRIHEGEQISKNPKKAQRGYLNIYKWYRDDYRKYPEAEISIINRIICHRGTDSRLKYLSFYLRRLVDQWRKKIDRSNSL